MWPRAGQSGPDSLAMEEIDVNTTTGWYRTLGRTGVRVSALTLGTMNFGPRFHPDDALATQVISAALEAGINFVDTADVYGSEEIVGRAIKAHRDDIVLASKFFNRMGPDVNHYGASRRWIFKAVEASLSRLGTDHLDLYQLHKPDTDTDFDETVGALSDLVHQGKIRYFGTTTSEAHHLVEAQTVARERGHLRPVTEQPPYSILAREAERALLPVAQQYGLGVLTWSPLAGGWLSGRWRRGENVETSSRVHGNGARHNPEQPENIAKRAAAERLGELADAVGIPLASLSVAWILRHPAVTSVIVGPRTPGQVTQLVEAAALALDDDLLDAIDAIVPPGVTLNPADRGWTPPWLDDASRRRRALPNGTRTVGSGAVAPTGDHWPAR
jgi:aryl-alcohol dehydrogenase-like predicted oxidoreductase